MVFRWNAGIQKKNPHTELDHQECEEWTFPRKLGKDPVEPFLLRHALLKLDASIFVDILPELTHRPDSCGYSPLTLRQGWTSLGAAKPRPAPKMRLRGKLCEPAAPKRPHQ
ncbi:Hypothetical predicted protein [Cloeon dipterum]|uniref:Uncharacterized protein n=1 Tax=Cloeon dipterum TaxID=197152 RepID=A0A8S1E5Z9_9INSE|nr:Hypothetical predicted protein [Cloeon dipterum]